MEAASAVDMEVGEAEEEADAFLENEILTRGAHYVIACGYSLGGLGKCWSPQACSRLGVLQAHKCTRFMRERQARHRILNAPSHLV